ncbi:Actin cytoskeleton-regulatory complex protein sla1 [Cytospora mali]|uniref:Actin cytoskeleton-regulatory complex protein SLA1 n=1 Tax=Cytospora mali TaxID=578113 RepID=A0A194VRD5_CYTMA|nr:Actin cytoskeleton-regulatory complex protein sla1 [Valsa mali]
MGFLGVYKAVYDYTPQSEGELQITEGDLLFVLENGEEDDWWKAKKKATAEDEEEPVGLIPNNYIEQAQPIDKARALYEYTRQTDEELSFPEDAVLEVFDTSDPDWTLVGLNGDYGFVPSNYIDMGEGEGDAGGHVEPSPQPKSAPEPEPEPEPAPPSLPTRPVAPPAPTVEEDEPSPPLPTRHVAPEPSSPPAASPASAMAAVMGGRPSAPPAVARDTPPPPALNIAPIPRDEPSGHEISPPLPSRQRTSTIHSAISDSHNDSLSPPARQSSFRDFSQYDRKSSVADREFQPRSQDLSPGGFHMYNINEMISIMGKKKKMPTTLGINLKTGNILIAPEHAQDGPSHEWTAEKMTHYSREGKHVFIELVKPSKSVDFHAGAKDTAEEIVAALGELAGAVRAEGLREVIMAGTGREFKKGKMLYDFMAQGEDEVTVADGDEVIILDDSKSEDWWQIRRVKTGKEGVVPSSYVEILGTTPALPETMTGINAGRSTVAQNRLEEERLTKEAVKAARAEVGPGMRLPERGSSLSARERNSNVSSQRKNENGHGGSSSRSSAKSKPDASKVRTWTDRSKSFSVEAQFLGLKDGKINLHKVNGVKIAVPIVKMSIEDLEYVELVTGISLDEDKPLSEVKRSRTQRQQKSHVGASIEPKKPEYDWFQFFLDCEIQPGLCERYSQAFARDSMDETVLPDVDASVLRTLGLREGDIIKVMRYLDNKYGRKKKGDEVQGEGGLFSGPGGVLKNNTGRPRPEANRSTGDVVDPKALGGSEASSPAVLTPATTTSALSTGKEGGFEDDAWDVKPAKSQPAAEPTPKVEAQPTPVMPAEPLKPALTPGMQELSLLTEPLQPTQTGASVQAPLVTQPPPTTTAPVPAQIPQATGATPSFFSALAQQQTGLPNGQQQQMTPLSQQLSLARQRPTPPMGIQGQTGIMPPPPAKPLSAPQSAQPSQFALPPMAPQVTGQVAPPGQSLNEMNQQRMQQQYMQQMQSQMTGFPQQQQPGMVPMQTGMQPQATGFGQNQFMQQQQPMMTGQQMGQSPFGDPRVSQQFTGMAPQSTGFQGQYGQPGQQFPTPTGGINSYLPPALEPQRTGMAQPVQPQPTGMSFTAGFGNHGMQQTGPTVQPPTAPLMPQKTGPPPPVRFGVQPDANKMMPQATGRRANLSAATPDNPFGF